MGISLPWEPYDRGFQRPKKVENLCLRKQLYGSTVVVHTSNIFTLTVSSQLYVFCVRSM